MIVHFGTDLISAEWAASTVCVGVFDGVHLGHQEVVRTAVEVAKQHEQPCVLVTFDRHPAWVLAPEWVPLAIATLGQNLDEFSRLGVSVSVVLPFDQAMAATSAEEFLSTTLQDCLRAERLVVGHDFALGKNRRGTGEWLASQIEATIVPPFEREGHRVASSEIRRFVTSGQVERAAQFLGRPFELRGVVVPGQRLGRTISFPTVNLALSTRQCTPVDGVYGGWCSTPLGRFRAAIGIGCRPTVGGQHRSIEAYLIDYTGDDLYGSVIDLGFAIRIRDEEHFPTLDELKVQMQHDVDSVRQRVS